MPALENDRYPLGRFERPRAPLETSARAGLIDAIEQTPETIRSLVEPLDDTQLETPSWHGRHHAAHIRNAIAR